MKVRRFEIAIDLIDLKLKMEGLFVCLSFNFFVLFFGEYSSGLIILMLWKLCLFTSTSFKCSVFNCLSA